MNNTICKKTIQFGKIAVGGSKKIYPAEIDIELLNDNGHTELSICGMVYNTKRTDIITGGQCLDTMNKDKTLRLSPLWREIYSLWCNYHLNATNAGTMRQENELKKKNLLNANQYDEACSYLRSVGLYFDKLTDTEQIYGDEDNEERRNHYAYGTAWIVRRLPNTVISRVREICAA